MKFTKTVKIEGMHCSGCMGRVASALAALDGVKKATADLKTGTATVVSEKEISESVLRETVEALGFIYLG